MKAKFKVGDKVRILDGNNIEDYIGTFVPDMEKFIGEVDTIRKIEESWLGIGYYLEHNTWIWDERGLELVAKNNERIVIYRNGSETIALDKTTGKKAVATCSPEDEYDLCTGAKIALERLCKPEPEQLYNGKVVCVDLCGCNYNSYTVGKVYEIKDGIITNDEGLKMQTGVHNFEEWQDWTSSKFVELVE